jgi:transcriptional regulator with XRE-family HTH domain
MKSLSSTKPNVPRLADRIRLARHAAKLSQAALAERVGVTPGAVAQWESTNGTKPALERLEAIATATGAVYEWLAIGRGDPRRRKAAAESTPAVALDSFARDFPEEMVLDYFRRLPPQARGFLNSFLNAMVSRRQK